MDRAKAESVLKPKKFFCTMLSSLAFLCTATAASAQSSHSGVWTADPSNQVTNPYANQTQPQSSPVTQNGAPPASSGNHGGYGYAPAFRKGYYRLSAPNNLNYRQASATTASSRANNANVAPQVRGKVSQQYDFSEQLNGRSYLVHVPRNYNPKVATPVVFVFHGLGMNGMAVRGLSAMDLTAEQNGFITVYPNAINAQWNDGIQPRANNDDVGFVSDIISALPKKFHIDNRRVYACGISNGGYFVERLACDLSTRIAAVSVVAASASSSVCAGCSARHGMPIVFFLGSDDPLVPHEGQSKELGKLGDALGLTDLGIKNIDATAARVGGFMTAEDAVEFWAKNNSCSSSPRHEILPDRDARDGCKVSRDTYGGGIGGADVVVYNVEGGGHSWPGGTGFVAKDILGRTCNDISASDIMWDFFKNRSR